MKRLQPQLLLALTLLFALRADAQYNLPQSRVWAMGNRTGLDFTNPANPTPFVSALANSGEAAASICDTAGQLLFYTHGGIVWNRNHLPMPNGSTLMPISASSLSTTQGAVIVPVPDSAGKYYIFSLTAVSNCRLYCNKIDMSLNGGLGDVDMSFPLRHQSLADSFLTEKMTAVPGCNNSVWLVVHTQGAPVYRAYHITPAGINLTPVFSAVGTYPGANYLQGVIKFSPDRTRMLNCNFRATAPTNAGIEVHNFDYITGIISNAVSLDAGSYYGGSFSPDGSKVYAGSTATMNVGAIFTWDLEAPSPAASKTNLGPAGQYTDLKLGPDGKIYFGALAGGAGYNNYRYMGRINTPNNGAATCGYKDSVTSLYFPNAAATAGTLAQGLPNDVAVPVAATNLYVRSLDTSICAAMQPYVLTSVAGYSSRLWDNGDTTLNRTVPGRGTYWLRSTSACNTRVDTFVIRGADMPALSITYSNPVLTATAGFTGYQWYRNGQAIAGATAASYTSTSNALYSVAATFTGGCSDSASYTVTDAAVIKNAGFAQVRIYPNPTTGKLMVDAGQVINITVCSLDGRVLLTARHSTSVDLGNLAGGLYLVHIADGNNQRLHSEKIMKSTF